MTSISLPTLAPIVYKFAKDALKKDNDHFYGLVYTVDYGVIKTERFAAFDYEDDLFLVQKVDENRSHWWLKNFDAEKQYWGGTSNLPDGGTKNLDCLFRASVFHDCGYSKVEAISKATGIPEKVLLAFFDDCFKILSEGYGASKKVTGPIYQALRLGGNLYHQIMKLFAVLLILFLTGCYTVRTEMESPPPNIEWTEPIFIGDTK